EQRRLASFLTSHHRVDFRSIDGTSVDQLQMTDSTEFFNGIGRELSFDALTNQSAARPRTISSGKQSRQRADDKPVTGQFLMQEEGNGPPHSSGTAVCGPHENTLLASPPVHPRVAIGIAVHTGGGPEHGPRA
ncbi:hypothetical protein, partial [Pseudoxanthomonas japonensis]|uniref:hypothetical protein n=1 Tax=Pseudoxanthomonas japonensis TaxID=69284 RepID=UPI001BCB749C